MSLFSAQEMMEHLIAKKDLSQSMINELMDNFFTGKIPNVQVGALLALLRAKGESADEIYFALKNVLAKAKNFETNLPICDIVGTGGDGFNTINASSIASIVAAAGGVYVAKHGSKAFSSKCGSADVLEEIGINVSTLPTHKVLECLNKNQWCFLYAPLFHPLFAATKPQRSELKIKTIFNILGPLANPSNPKITLLGVNHPNLIEKVSLCLLKNNHTKALVVHGSGLDEIAIHGPTQMSFLNNGKIEKITITPNDLGLKTFKLTHIQGDDKKYNSKIFLDVIYARANEAHTSFVAANAGALLWINDKAKSLKDGVQLALDTIFNKKALLKFESIRETCNGSITNCGS